MQHVAAADLDGVKAERAGDGLDGAVHDPACDGHRRAHRPCAAFVGQDHAHVEGIVGDAVGAGEDHRHDARHVVRGVEAVGAEIFQDRDLQRGDAALGVGGGAGLHGLLAGVAGGQQVLAPALAPAHGAVEGAGQGGDGQLFAVQGDLLAERAANVGADDRDLGFGQPKPLGELRAIGMRRLVACVHGQVLAPLVPDRAAAACLQRRVRLAVLGEFRFHDTMRGGEATCGVAGGKLLPRDQVAGQRVVDAGCVVA